MEHRKKIWYISHYVTPPKFDTHARAIKFSQYLKDEGFDVTIIGSSFLHNKNIHLITDKRKYVKRKYGEIQFIHIKTKSYHKNGLRRIYSLLQFSMRIYFLRNEFEKPDYIIHTAQIPFENFMYFVAKKMKAKYIIEVLDLWPESFVAYGLIHKKNPLLHLFYQTEKWLYKKADKIIFSMEGGKDYVIEKKWDKNNGGPIDLNKVHHVNNGVDLEEFENNISQYKIDDPDLIMKDSFKVIYIGSIRLANNLKQLIDAAALLKDYSNIKFLIYGDGGEREKLENFCKVNNLNNVLFKQKWIELKYVPYVLSKSSLNILNYKKNDVLRYGGSQGKLFQYIASGKPLCSNLKMGYCLIDKYNIGISEKFESSKQYADAILRIAELNKDDYNKIKNNAKKVARQYDFKVLTRKLVTILNT